MNIVIRLNRNKIVATLAIGLILLTAQSAISRQSAAQGRFATELDAFATAASHDNPALIREERESEVPFIRDDQCREYPARADRNRRNALTSRLP